MTQSVIITGASSGIGEALARRMARAGYEVGLTARRLDNLQEIGEELPTRSYVARMDVTDTEEARAILRELVDSMDGVDMVVLNAGIAPINPDLEWEIDEATIETNVTGFAALATAAIHEFEDQGHGHLVGISSVSAHVGLSHEPAYSGSKAFVSNYLEGIRYRAHDRDADVTVTTIEPGYVDTDLSLDNFWEASVDTAAEQIFTAIRNERKHAYVTRRWRLIAWLLDTAPDALKRQFV
jgi:NADP-dependent 3-hydroxy acid dehydrogenase YdfG